MANDDGPLLGYECPSCGFDTDIANCDDCDAIVKWDTVIGGSAQCTGCGMEITFITCRVCGEKFDL